MFLLPTGCVHLQILSLSLFLEEILEHLITMLYITSPQFVYLETGSFYLLTPFTHFLHKDYYESLEFLFSQGVGVNCSNMGMEVALSLLHWCTVAMREVRQPPDPLQPKLMVFLKVQLFMQRRGPLCSSLVFSIDSIC